LGWWYLDVRDSGAEGVFEFNLFTDFFGEFEGGEVDLPELEVVLELDISFSVNFLYLFPELPQLPSRLAPVQDRPVLLGFRPVVQQQLPLWCFHPKKLEILSTKYSHS
jgi:hypothetical protein